MPSRLPGYPPDTAGRSTYAWPPRPQGVPSGPSPSSPPGAQSKPFYGYLVGPAGSFRGPHLPYSHGEQPPPDDYRGYGNEHPGYEFAREKNPEGPTDHDHYRRPPNQAGPYPPHPYGPQRAAPTSPLSRTSSHASSYEHHDYPRVPEGPPTYGPPLHHSRSSGSTGSSPQASPPQKYPSDGRPPHGYREAVPHSYVSARPPPPQHGRVPPPPPGYASSSFDSDRPWQERASPPSYPPEADHRGHYDGARDHYSWGGGPPPPPPSYGAAHPPYLPPPHARKSLAPESVPRPKGYDSRQASDASRGGRVQSPTQIESSRRDEVATMGCTCKKSKCLKLYCMCFGASVVCGPNCRCLVCYNTPNFETERKEAVRAILSRNPAAFDTKFKKTTDQAAAETDRLLAHKLGCKCRKSACTKKYCECFNAGIKCSATCRCMGCQNMPPGGFGPDPRYGYSMPPQTYVAGALQMKNKYPAEEQASAKTGEPLMVDAAQNLAFLKHASPNRPEGRPLVPSDSHAIASVPSIVSADTTPTSDTEIVVSDETPAAGHVHPAGGKSQERSKSNGEVANALLMAAYAMTELHSKDTDPSKPAASAKDAPSGVLRASPKRKSAELPNERHKGDGPEIVQMTAGEARDSDAAPAPFPDAPKQCKLSPTATFTPSLQRKTKRSRLGSVKKSVHAEASVVVHDTPRLEKHSVDSDEELENKSPSHTIPSIEEREEEIAATPAAKTTSSKDIITPVTARCIDFRRMDVNEVKEENKDDTP